MFLKYLKSQSSIDFFIPKTEVTHDFIDFFAGIGERLMLIYGEGN